MLRKREPKPAPVPPTTEELIVRHRQLAENHLARAAKAGRLDAETRFAAMATAHATLAVSYQLQLESDKQLPPPSEEDVEEE